MSTDAARVWWKRVRSNGQDYYMAFIRINGQDHYWFSDTDFERFTKRFQTASLVKDSVVTDPERIYQELQKKNRLELILNGETFVISRQEASRFTLEEPDGTQLTTHWGRMCRRLAELMSCPMADVRRVS